MQIVRSGSIPNHDLMDGWMASRPEISASDVDSRPSTAFREWDEWNYRQQIIKAYGSEQEYQRQIQDAFMGQYGDLAAQNQQMGYLGGPFSLSGLAGSALFGCSLCPHCGKPI